MALSADVTDLTGGAWRRKYELNRFLFPSLCPGTPTFQLLSFLPWESLALRVTEWIILLNPQPSILGGHQVLACFYFISFNPFISSPTLCVSSLFLPIGMSLRSVWYALKKTLTVSHLTSAHQAPLSMGLSRQGYWSGLAFLSPGDLLEPGTEPRSPALQADSLPSKPLRKPWYAWTLIKGVMLLIMCLCF